MKNIFLLIFILTIGSSMFQSCSTQQTEPAPKVTKSQPFMPKTEIVAQFKSMMEDKSVMDDHLTQEAIERLKQIDGDLISPDELKKIREQQNEMEMRKKDSERSEQLVKAPKDVVDRRHCDSPAVSQCGGTCTSHGISNAMDNLFCKPNVQQMSNQHLWSTYQRYSTYTGIRAAAKNKICDEAYWPNCKSKTDKCNDNSHIKLLEFEEIGANYEKGMAALDAGFPLVYSGKVTSSWANCDSVIYPKSRASGGGHAVAVSGYALDPDVPGGGYFIILNSWGKNCGDNGYQYIPFNYCLRQDNGMYCDLKIIKKIDTKYNNDPNPPTPPTPQPKPDCEWKKFCKEKKKWWVLWRDAYYYKCYWEKVCK